MVVIIYCYIGCEDKATTWFLDHVVHLPWPTASARVIRSAPKASRELLAGAFGVDAVECVGPGLPLTSGITHPKHRVLVDRAPFGRLGEICSRDRPTSRLSRPASSIVSSGWLECCVTAIIVAVAIVRILRTKQGDLCYRVLGAVCWT